MSATLSDILNDALKAISSLKSGLVNLAKETGVSIKQPANTEEEVVTTQPSTDVATVEVLDTRFARAVPNNKLVKIGDDYVQTQKVVKPSWEWLGDDESFEIKAYLNEPVQFNLRSMVTYFMNDEDQASFAYRPFDLDMREVVVTEGLPEGIGFDEVGRMTGTPTQVGKSDFTITLANGVSRNATFSVEEAVDVQEYLDTLEMSISLEYPEDEELPPTTSIIIATNAKQFGLVDEVRIYTKNSELLSSGDLLKGTPEDHNGSLVRGKQYVTNNPSDANGVKLRPFLLVAEVTGHLADPLITSIEIFYRNRRYTRVFDHDARTGSGETA